MPALRLSSGSVEAVKWLALVLMTGDHINWFLLDSSLPLLYELGRLAFPLFALVVAYNLARPGADYWRAARRLALFGVIALVPHWYLTNVDGLAFLNVFFTFALAAAIMGLINAGRYELAAVVFTVGGLAVEYVWLGVALTLCAWWYFRSGSRYAMAAAVGALASLVMVNGNHWALFSVLVVFLASASTSRIPRHRWAFYAYYPAHLVVLALLAGV